MYISLNSKGLCNLEANQAVTALEQMKESCDKTLSKVCGSGSSAFLHQGRDFLSLSCLCSRPGSSIPELCVSTVGVHGDNQLPGPALNQTGGM